MNIVLIKDKERKYIRVMAKLFSVTIGWLCGYLKGGKMRVKVLYSVLALVVILVIGCSETTSPESNKPSDLQITLVEENIIKLTWQDNSTDEDKFFIDRKKGEYEWFENYNQVAANITTFNDFIITNTDTVYSYRIRSFDGSNYSEYSMPAGWFSDITTPTNLQLEQIAQDSIRLTWCDNSIGELNFRIDRKIEGEEWTEGYKIIEENKEEYIDFNSDLYAPCYYRVSSASGNSSSNYDESYINAFNPPSNLIVSLLDDVTFLLEWDDNSNYEVGYKIERKKENEEYVLLDSVGQNINTYIDNSIEEFTKYYYRVYGFNQEFQTNYSNIANATWYSGIIYVPDYFDDIQNAIDIAQSGDTIIVRTGFYSENIELHNKNIILASEFLTTGNENIISQTIISGGNNDSVIRIFSDINSSTLICGFTIQSGYDDYGGGIYCSGNPILSNLIISDNSAESKGGGIYISGNPHLINLTINSNSATYGGGIYFDGDGFLFENSIVSNNISFNGGGLTISTNVNPNSPNEINNVVIQNNSSTYFSAVSCNDDTIFRNVIIRNHSGDDALSMSSSNSIFLNSIIDNSVLAAKNGANVSFINCIINGENLTITGMGGASAFEISYCDIIGGQSSIYIHHTGELNWLEGNINLDPLFVGNDDYHLQTGSPCIDAGNPASQYNDPDGSRNDMGAYGGPNGEW